MFKFHIISVFILILVFQSNGNPSPRESEAVIPGIPKNRDQYKEYIEYVDEEVGPDGGGPDERFEIIDSEEDPNSEGSYAESNAEVVDDVNLDQFDKNGNFIGSPVSNNQAHSIEGEAQPQSQFRQITAEEFNKQVGNNDQDEYEEEEEDIKEPSKQSSITQQIYSSPQKPRTNSWYNSPKPTQNPYKVIEQSYPGIFESIKNSNKQKSVGTSSSGLTSNGKSDYQKEYEPVRTKFNQYQDKGSYKNYPDSFQRVKNSNEQKSQSWNKLGNQNDYYPEEEEFELAESKYDQVEKKQSEENYQNYPDTFERMENTYNQKIEQRKKQVNNDKRLYQKEYEQAQSNFKKKSYKVKGKDQDTEYEYVEEEPVIIYDSDSTTTTTSESPVQHMDIHPAFNTPNHVVIQQLSGAKGKEPGAVRITEQLNKNQTSRGFTPSSSLHKSPSSNAQGKYQETVFKPKRKARILARYKVIIPVIVPNLRIRYTYEGNTQQNQTKST